MTGFRQLSQSGAGNGKILKYVRPLTHRKTYKIIKLPVGPRLGYLTRQSHNAESPRYLEFQSTL